MKKVYLELQAIEPPKVLYHGTATRFSESICKEGIMKQSKQYVHLSAEVETATKVGKRQGELVIKTFFYVCFGNLMI